MILTPDQRLRVFVSSTLQELAPERVAARAAIESLRLTPVLFELGARPHPPRELYRSYLEQSQVFVSIYWQSYGWIAPGEEISGLEDEYLLAGDKPRLVYVKEPADQRQPELSALLDRVRAEDTVSYKKFAAPEELGELIAQDLALLVTERFRSGDVPTRVRDVPARATSFVGRREELAEIESLLGGSVRLVTLTGPGGIGKTRLAVEAADRSRRQFRDGIAFVPLEGLASPDLVRGAISSALGIRDPGADPLESVAAHLRGRSLLLVLDNFEHVMAAAPVVATLLETCAELSVLVTSRELLRLRGEHELRVPPLDPEAEATALFVERAGAVLRTFELGAEDAQLIAEICRRLDGVPLAIELAAPRLRLLTPEQLLEGLRERIALAGPRDAPARQRTLEAAIAWSYELLEPAEQRVFERLSVFRGSFTFESAAAVCGLSHGELLELVASLLDKSVVYRLPETVETRFGMLSMLREFAHERLEQSGELDAAFDGLTTYFVELAVLSEYGLRSGEKRAWTRVIDLEADTMRAELAWLSEHGRIDELVTLIRGTWPWFWHHGRGAEARMWVGLARPYEEQLAVEQRAWLVGTDALFAFFMLDIEVAVPRLAQARALFEEAGDRTGVATVDAIAGFVTGMIAGEDAALEQLERAVASFEELGDVWGSAGAVGTICRIRSIFGHYEGHRELFERGVALAEQTGDDLLTVLALTNLADYSFAVGELDASRAYVERTLALIDAAGIRYGAADVLESLARLEAAAGEHARAAELVGTAVALRESMFLPLWGPLAERNERFVEGLRETLGVEEFERARARGSDTPLDRWLVPA